MQLSEVPARSSIVSKNSALTRYMNVSCADKFYFMGTMGVHGEKSIIMWKIKELEENQRQ